MSYGGFPYGGVGYAGADVGEIPQADTRTALSVEVAFTTGALETPVWVDITEDVRSWDVSRGRSRELERHQPGRATIVLANLSRQYDSVYVDGPYFGNLRPMRRVRIRETFNGVTYPVFNGFVDRWVLDYPSVGIDATATLIATDAFKIWARTNLLSVFEQEMAADDPAFWWRLDESLDRFLVGGALNSGSVGTDGNGTFLAGDPGGRAMIVNLSNQSLELTNDTVRPGSPVMGVTIPVAQINLLSRFTNGEAFTLSGWCRPVGTSTRMILFEQRKSTATTWEVRLAWANAAGSNAGSFEFRLWDRNVTVNASSSAVDSNPPENDYFVAVTAEPSGSDMLVKLYVNGALVDSDTFTLNPTSTSVTISAIGNENDQDFNWSGRLSNVAIYTEALSADRIDAIYDAGTHPWQGDGPDDRLGRILDIAGWPSDLRSIDTNSATSLQSAALEGQTVLEHAQKIAETDFGLLFVDRAGNARFVSRVSQSTRTASPAVYGDGVGDVGYRSIRPDDGDEVIRNVAVISRLNGVAQTVTGTTTDEFGTFQYALDGLLHDTDAYSASYANFIVDEYQDPRRRIVELQIGPPPDGEEDVFYPAMLGPELGDAISVTHTPQALGDPFEQTCVIEGIEHASAPGRNRTTKFVLSPEFTQTLF